MRICIISQMIEHQPRGKITEELGTLKNPFAETARFLGSVPYNTTIVILMAIYKIDAMLGAPLASAVKRNP